MEWNVREKNVDRLHGIKEERRLREEQKKQKHLIIKAQNRFRGYIGRCQVLQSLRVDYDKKLADIEKLQEVLQGQQRPRFVPPIELVIRLSRCFTFFYGKPRYMKRHQQGDLLRCEKLCRILLIPALESFNSFLMHKDVQVQAKGRRYSYWFCKFIQSILINHVLPALPSYYYKDDDGNGLHSVIVILELLGRQSCAVLRSLVAFSVLPIIRGICLEKDPTFAEPSRFRDLGAVSLNNIHPLHPLFRLSSALLSAELEGQDANGPVGTKTSTTGVDAPINEYAKYYVHQMQTLPLFSVKARDKFSDKVLIELAKVWKLTATKEEEEELPPSPNATGDSLLWLLANTCYITAMNPMSSRKTMLAVIDALCPLLEQAPPGIAWDQGIISFQRQGAHTMTLAVPAVVVESIQLVFKETFLRNSLVPSFLVDFEEKEEYLKSRARKEDVNDVAKALHTSSLQLTDAMTRKQQQDSQTSLVWRWTQQAVSTLASIIPTARSGGRAEEHRTQGENMEEEEEEEERFVSRTAEQQQQQDRYNDDSRIKLETMVHFLAIVFWKAHLASSTYDLRTAAGGSSTNLIKLGLLNVLAFSTPFTPLLFVHLLHYYDKDLTNISKISWTLEKAPRHKLFLLLPVLSLIYGHQLIVVRDDEMHKQSYPLPLNQVVRLIKFLKVFSFQGCLAHAAAAATTDTQGRKDDEKSSEDRSYNIFALNATTNLLKILFERWSRRAFCAAEVWSVQDSEKNRSILRAIRQQTPLGLLLLNKMPYAVAFAERLGLFQHWIGLEKRLYQPEGTRGIHIKIRRGYVMEDGLLAFSNSAVSEKMKARLVIVYINEAGAQEAGIDAGGLFKDFLVDLCATIFNPSFGLFVPTEASDRLLYPNPCSHLIHPNGEDLALYTFIGRILGKAMYENIAISPVFAPFFLSHLNKSYNYMNMYDDLQLLDVELYKNLRYLEKCEDEEDLALTFSICHEDLGKQEEIELVPNGRNIPVTRANKFQYIHLVAKHYLYDRLAGQSQAFVRGFHEVIAPSILRMFNEPELQIMISGNQGGIDLEDLKRNTRYAGGYTAVDRHVRRLWRCVQSFSSEEKAAFIRFITASPRPPVNGFKDLHPPLTIHHVGIRRDNERLPTARTCFNQLHWPTYSSDQVAREKLLYAIFSHAGFELS